MLRVDDEIGPDFLRVRQFTVVDVDRADQQTHRFGILNAKMSEPPATGDRDPLTGLRLSLLDSLIGGDARANKRRSFRGGKAFRDMRHVIGVSQNVFRETTVSCIAAELRIWTDRLPSC